MVSDLEAVESFFKNLKEHYELWKASTRGNGMGDILIFKNEEKLVEQAENLQKELGKVEHILYRFETYWIMQQYGMAWDALKESVGDPTRNSKAESICMVLERLSYILGKLEVEDATKDEDRGTWSYGDKVFIIHGHDKENALVLEKMLHDKPFKLETIILSDKLGKGRTLIEKFEQEAAEAGYAIALVTPDDFVLRDNKEIDSSDPKQEASSYAQCRPNVLFELGWFYGKLTRERVLIVMKKGTTIPTDLDGIDRCDFETTVDEQSSRFFKELSGAGMIS